MEQSDWIQNQHTHTNQLYFYMPAIKKQNKNFKKCIIDNNIKIKYLEVDVSEYVQEFYIENDEAFLREIKTDLCEWKGTSFP